jgi:hypothetical protein
MTMAIVPGVAKDGTVERQPLRLSTVAPQALAGVPYELQLAVTGGVPPYSWGRLFVVPGGELSDAGLLKIADPAVVTGGLSVQVVDSVGQNAWGTIDLKVLRPTDPLLKAAAVAGAVAGWLILLVLMRSFVEGTIQIRWRGNLAALLSVSFFLVAIGVSLSPLGMYGFAVLTIGLGLYIFRKFA